MHSTKATLIYLENCILLSKTIYENWREVQDKYKDSYKTNLAPMTCEEIICFFKDDFGEEAHWPFSKGRILEFFKSNSKIIKSNETGQFPSENQKLF